MKKIVYSLLLIITVGCKERYESPVHSPVTGYLVVEGVINSAAGGTTIILSRTTQLDNRNAQYENGAQVNIEGDDNSFYTLFESTAGHYNAVTAGLNSGTKYRLHIITGTGKEYLSDFVSVNSNPPMDSVSWQRENSGLQLYINTHDPQNNTRYYQWEYSETWEFHSAYATSLKYNIDHGPNGKQIYSIAYRDSTTFSPDPTLFYCWQSDQSSNILIGSSAKLATDLIYLPLVFIPPASWKLSVLYSIDVKQYSWTKEGYEFLERMKKNTESTGSVFDAQPSELNGNMHCVSDPAEPVIGFINICPFREQRTFIRNDQIPNWRYDSGCSEEIIPNNDPSIQLYAINLLPTTPDELGPGGIISFYAAIPTCVDCTLRGTNVKPSFWP
jgi:Domain of unknown function (DUF4249)